MAVVTVKLWEALHSQSRFLPIYPSERVVQWVAGLPASSVVLDYGCGGGRHSLLLSNLGHTPVCYDPSSNARLVTKERLRDLSGMVVENCEELPDDSLDGVLCYGVLYYMTLPERKQAINLMWRKLMTGAPALIVVRSTKDSRYKDRSVGRATNEAGMYMDFFTPAKLRREFHAFTTLQIDQQLQTYGAEVDHDYIITLRK